MRPNRLGIIGGMGPKATAVFMDKIIDNTVAECDQDHIDMIVLNHATLPDRTATIRSGDSRAFLDGIAGDIRLLELAGASNIAIPCNTSHYYYDEIQAMTSIPVIHMVDETVRDIRRRFGDGCRVGVLATDGTMKSGVYRKACEAHGLELFAPDDAAQEQVMRIIYRVKGDQPVDPAELEAIVHDLVWRHDCRSVILACTELSCIPLQDGIAAYCTDAMDVLVRESIERSGKRMKRRL